MAVFQVSVSQGCVFFVSVIVRVGMCVRAVVRMKSVRFCAAVEGSSSSTRVQLVVLKVALREVQSAFLKSYICRDVDVSCGVGKSSVVRVALRFAIVGRTIVFVCEGKFVQKGSSK